MNRFDERLWSVGQSFWSGQDVVSYGTNPPPLRGTSVSLFGTEFTDRRRSRPIGVRRAR